MDVYAGLAVGALPDGLRRHPGGGEEGPPESPDDTATSAPPSDHNSDSSLGGTYWTAVQHESYNDLFDRTEVSQMPTERWWADLFLNEDGTAQFREVPGDSFNSYLGNGTGGSARITPCG